MSKQIEQRARIGKIFARWHLTIAITSNILIFILIFYFPLLIARDKCLLFCKRAILSFRYHKFIFFIRCFFSQNQARHLTA